MTDPYDYSLEDVRAAVAEPHGYTLDQVMQLDFPAADYQTDGAPYWRWETVTNWLHSFQAALATSGRAHHLERFEEFAKVMRTAMVEARP